jgi:tetratricopeptide (TPR) repeat protein
MVMISQKHSTSIVIGVRITMLILCLATILGISSPSYAKPRRVCVSTLENLDAAGDNYWLGHFIADSIVKNLGVLPELKVVHQTDSVNLPAEVCPEDAALRIYGNFRDEGDAITVRTYCVQEGEPLRPAEASFVSSLSDLYPRLAELAVSLAGCSSVDYSQTQLARIRRPPTSSQEAIAFYGRGLVAPALSVERGIWLLRAVSKDASYTDALYRLGAHYRDTDLLAEAFIAFERLSEIDPNYPHLYYNLGFVYRSAGEYTLAAEMYRKAVEIQPEDADAWNNLGVAYYLADLREEAGEAFEVALKIDPENPGIRANLAAVSRASSLHAEKPSYEPSEASAMMRHVDTGAAFYAIGDYYRAIEKFEEALMIDPNNFKANRNMGLSCLKINDLEKARKHFERALKADPSAEDVRDYLERINSKLEKTSPPTEATTESEESLLDPSRKAHALNAAGRVYLAREAYETAADMFIQSLQLLPNDANTVIELGHAYFGMREYDNAREQFSIALKIEPENSVAEQRLAEAVYVLNGKEAGQEHGDGTTESGFSMVEARGCLVRGNWFSDEGKYARAAAEYLRGLDFAPALTEALNNLANAYYMIGNNERAIAALKKARLLEPDNEIVERNLDVIGATVNIYDDAGVEPLEIFSLDPTTDGSSRADENS